MQVYNNITSSSRSSGGFPAQLFDEPWYVLLNTAIGGPWPKPVAPSTVFPTYHYIDKVVVAERV